MSRTLLVLLVCGSWALAPIALGQSTAAHARSARSSPSPVLDARSLDAIVQQAYLKASNTGESDRFGDSVSVSGNTVVIGASWEGSGATGVDGDENDNSVPFSGAAYVFVRNGATWSQQAYLKASNTGFDDEFGSSVSISGDTIVVGAFGEDSGATHVNGDGTDDSAVDSGAAYVFVRSGTSWSQQAYLKASNTDAGDHFGLSVSVSGDAVVVGARDEDSSATGVDGNQDNNSAPGAGAAYVFVRSGTSWSQQAYLKASNAEASEWFGDAVAVSADTIVVGARYEDSGAVGVDGDQSDNSEGNSGAAYVFVRNGTSWQQQAYLKASNTGAGDFFGAAVAVAADTAVIGAAEEDSAATGVDGDGSNNLAASAGAAYVFVRNGTTWSQQAYLKASNTDVEDSFAWSVAVSGNTVLVGAWLEDSNATGVDGDQSNDFADSSGAAYVFVRSGKNWSQRAYLKASNTEGGDWFGRTVSLSGDMVVAGARSEDSRAVGVNGDQNNNFKPQSGAAYAFDLGLGSWTGLASGLAGSSGVPLLVGTGPLSPSSGNQLDLTSANSSSAATLVFGLSQLNAPFKGGTLVPTPLLLVPLATNPSGALSLPFTWPSNVPPGMALYFQFWINDAGGVAGFAASNGLEGLSS